MNSTAQSNTAILKKILLTGFSPFDGRAQNASWIAVKALTVALPRLDLQAVLIPVRWGAPARIMVPLVSQYRPDCIIAMGEGEPGVFRLETIARNARRERADNDGRYPEGQPIENGGPELRAATADCSGLQIALSAQGIPVKVSDDAGAFLCEEMLYTLEGLRESHEDLHSVLFVHVPPFGTELSYKGQPHTCDEELLLDFGRRLLHCMGAADIVTGVE